MMNNPDSLSIKTRLISVIIFAIAMGILEAIVVVYLFQFMLPPDVDSIPFTNFNFTIEIIREITTMVMLTAVAILAVFNWRTRLAMFFLAFGIWDIFYYISLKIFLDWPATIMDWDTLFLIPVAWYSPIIVPVLISIYFIIGSIFIIIHEGNGTKLKFSFSVVLLQFLGFAVWFYSFVKNSAMISENGYTNVEYSWALFFLGLIFGISSLIAAFILGKKSN